VGGNVTPNGLFDFSFRTPDGRIENVRGALSILRGEQGGEGEPAQVLRCPCCRAILAVPPDGFIQDRTVTVHLVVQCQNPNVTPNSISGPPQQIVGQGLVPLFRVTSVRVTTHSNREYHTLTLTIVPSRDVTALD